MIASRTRKPEMLIATVGTHYSECASRVAKNGLLDADQKRFGRTCEHELLFTNPTVSIPNTSDVMAFEETWNDGIGDGERFSTGDSVTFKISNQGFARNPNSTHIMDGIAALDCASPNGGIAPHYGLDSFEDGHIDRAHGNPNTPSVSVNVSISGNESKAVRGFFAVNGLEKVLIDCVLAIKSSFAQCLSPTV